MVELVLLSYGRTLFQVDLCLDLADGLFVLFGEGQGLDVETHLQPFLLGAEAIFIVLNYQQPSPGKFQKFIELLVYTYRRVQQLLIFICSPSDNWYTEVLDHVSTRINIQIERLKWHQVISGLVLYPL